MNLKIPSKLIHILEMLHFLNEIKQYQMIFMTSNLFSLEKLLSKVICKQSKMQNLLMNFELPKFLTSVLLQIKLHK